MTANLPNCSFFGRDLFEDIILTERRQTLKQSGSELFYHQPLCGRIPVTGLHFPMFRFNTNFSVVFLSEIDITRINWTTVIWGKLCLREGGPACFIRAPTPVTMLWLRSKITGFGWFWKQRDHSLYWDLVFVSGKASLKVLDKPSLAQEDRLSITIFLGIPQLHGAIGELCHTRGEQERRVSRSEVYQGHQVILIVYYDCSIWRWIAQLFLVGNRTLCFSQHLSDLTMQSGK